jgi:hypothetical protein
MSLPNHPPVSSEFFTRRYDDNWNKPVIKGLWICEHECPHLNSSVPIYIGKVLGGQAKHHVTDNPEYHDSCNESCPAYNRDIKNPRAHFRIATPMDALRALYFWSDRAGKSLEKTPQIIKNCRELKDLPCYQTLFNLATDLVNQHNDPNLTRRVYTPLSKFSDGSLGSPTDKTWSQAVHRRYYVLPTAEEDMHTQGLGDQVPGPSCRQGSVEMRRAHTANSWLPGQTTEWTVLHIHPTHSNPSSSVIVEDATSSQVDADGDIDMGTARMSLFLSHFRILKVHFALNSN